MSGSDIVAVVVFGGIVLVLLAQIVLAIIQETTKHE